MIRHRHSNGRSVGPAHVLLALAAVIMPAGELSAQPVDAPDDTTVSEATPIAKESSFHPELGEGYVVLTLFKKSRTINSIIVALSVIALLLFLYFLFTIRSSAMAPRRFVDEINKMVRDQDFSQAADYCRRNSHLFIANVIQRCLENTSKPHSVLMDMVDTEGRRRADIVWNRVSYLADVSNVAPMLGLLGTVVGMIQAFFFALPEGSASISSAVLSQSIGGAMATTMFGLIVGILALVFYSVTKGRLTQALADTEQVVNGITDQIKRSDS